MSGKVRKLFFAVGTRSDNHAGGEGRIFRDVPLPRGDTTRVMSRRVFEGAVSRADRKIEEVIQSMRAGKVAAE